MHSIKNVVKILTVFVSGFYSHQALTWLLSYLITHLENFIAIDLNLYLLTCRVT